MSKLISLYVCFLHGESVFWMSGWLSIYFCGVFLHPQRLCSFVFVVYFCIHKACVHLFFFLCSELLLESGSDLTVSDNDKNTPLHHACLHVSTITAVSFLLWLYCLLVHSLCTVTLWLYAASFLSLPTFDVFRGQIAFTDCSFFSMQFCTRLCFKCSANSSSKTADKIDNGYLEHLTHPKYLQIL